MNTRRRFLQSTAGLVAANTLLEAQQTAASDRVRFSMVGIGMQGSGLLATSIALPGIECAAAADLYDGRHTLAREITANHQRNWKMAASAACGTTTGRISRNRPFADAV